MVSIAMGEPAAPVLRWDPGPPTIPRPRQREAKTPLMQLFLLATLSFFAAFSPTSTMTRSHWTSRSANASLAPLPFHVMTIIMLPVFSYSKLLTMVVELVLERKQAAASSRTTTSQISPPRPLPTSTTTRSHWTSRSANASLAPLQFHV